LKGSEMTTDKLLTFEDLTEVLSVSRRTAIRLRDNGSIPAVKIGRSVRFRLSDIQAFIERGGVPHRLTEVPRRGRVGS